MLVLCVGQEQQYSRPGLAADVDSLALIVTGVCNTNRLYVGDVCWTGAAVLTARPCS